MVSGAVPAHVLCFGAFLGRTSYMHGIALACLHSPPDDAFALVHDLPTALKRHGQTQPTAELTQHRPVKWGHCHVI